MDENIKGINLVWLSKTGLTNLNAGEGEANLVDIKKYKKNGKEYPYVSGQAMRYYIKEAIRRNLEDGECMCIPDEKGEPSCKGNVDKCISCDLFGFMATIPKGTILPEYPKGHPGGAHTRVSPVKVSPAMGLLPAEETIVMDFLTRRKPQEIAEERRGDIVNVEIGTNLYRCGLAIDVARVGRTEDWTGETLTFKEVVNKGERIKRIKKVLEAIRFLTDYSKQARLLTDFTPDIICISFQNKYSYRLQKIFELKDGLKLDIRRIREILDDVKEYSEKIIFGMISGVIENEGEVKKIFEDYGIPAKTPAEALNEAIGFLSE